ncbi:hypothetical protein CfE428DRAFT_5827 [Chthoniobacter flavus Ellin428]|uniref:Uncharacterized protein n=1 Tax=Chthoniobacter flavus Ellin428 TaxID=497964 RepID=B4DA87_9BACT|nr:hypothetical protein [Chthoniobacter flavus]EDY16714.1 hypothetical protein CfE428DRAFT_5827 [Chthoniobacter flavus Ellin428]TCO87280.1 hypothetical protein EV701_123117 [Chthoniobacter flavus]
MIARSIHPIPEMPADDEGSLGDHSLPEVASRTRRVTNDPAREYAQRQGEVERLPDAVAALILCKKGWAKVERHQIKITLDGEELVFASRDSMVIAEKNGTGERVLWAVNRRAPELLHVLTKDGAYVESIPRKGEAQWFSHDAESRAAYADAQAQIQRDARRLRDLHTEDSAEAVRAAQANAATTERLVNTFPAPEAERSPSREGRFPEGERMAAAMAGAERRYTDGVENERQAQRREDQTLKLGEAMRDAVFSQD